MTSVFLVDDHALFRAGVRSEIGSRLDLVGEAETVDAAVTGILAMRPDVAVVDVHLPNGGGRAIIERVLAEWPDAVFLALSVSDAADDVVGVIRAGARGYVTKTIDADQLVDAIHRVHTGDAVFSPRLAGFVLDAFSAAPPTPVDPALDQLSNREQEVMRLIARGYTYREVAEQLHLSVKTIETHVSAVLRKLQLSNRHELTAWATDRRLL
jgi:DNA-binding NarL/FixJ family response regulator